MKDGLYNSTVIRLKLRRSELNYVSQKLPSSATHVEEANEFHLFNPNTSPPPKYPQSWGYNRHPSILIPRELPSHEAQVTSPGRYLPITVRETFLDKLIRLFPVIVVHLHNVST